MAEEKQQERESRSIEGEGMLSMIGDGIGTRAYLCRVNGSELPPYIEREIAKKAAMMGYKNGETVTYTVLISAPERDETTPGEFQGRIE